MSFKWKWLQRSRILFSWWEAGPFHSPLYPLLPPPFTPASQDMCGSIISPSFTFLHIFFKIYAYIRVFGTWFNCKLLNISGILWNKIYFLHLSVSLLKAADIANGYSWKTSSSFNAVKYLQLISVTCLHSHPTWWHKWKITSFNFKIPTNYI